MKINLEDVSMYDTLKTLGVDTDYFILHDLECHVCAPCRNEHDLKKTLKSPDYRRQEWYCEICGNALQFGD